VPNDELVLMSLPEGLTNFQRTLLLLQKSNKIQRLAGLQEDNLVCLCKENPLRFATEILPQISSDINVNKDEELIERTATSLEAIADLKVVRSKYMLELADILITHLRTFNQKRKDEMWTDLIVKLVSLYAKDNSYIDLAIDLADPLNNKSS
jgi:hypothetical protein